MKVAIWGSYNFGNYGDDLMAIQFAIFLKNQGVHPCVYRMNQKLADRYSIETTESIDELLDKAKFCMIGGGAMLEGISSKQKKTENDLFSMEQDFQALLSSCSAKQCPVYPISVGGDGRGENTPLAFHREKFWRSDICQKATVRLKEDLYLLKKFGKEALYYPDVLLGIDTVLNIPEPDVEENKVKVGINLYDNWKNRLFVNYLELIASVKKNLVFYFIQTHLSEYGNHSYELLPKRKSPYIKHHIYSDPILSLKFLKSLDLLVSSKLHLGLTALTLKTPFYSFKGKGKTWAFLKSIKADSAIFTSREYLKLAKHITNESLIKKAKTRFDFTLLEEQKALSLGHLNFLQARIKE